MGKYTVKIRITENYSEVISYESKDLDEAIKVLELMKEGNDEQ